MRSPSASPESASASTHPVRLELRDASGRIRTLHLEEGELLIGRADCCDLRLNDPSLPGVHSELHREGDAVWIEAAASEAPLEINGELHPRLALRDGDRVQVGRHELVIHFGATRLTEDRDVLDEDLSELSASELCDRILAEEAEIEADEFGRIAGWKQLIEAISATVATIPAADRGAHERIDQVLMELRGMVTMLGERSQQLEAREAEVLSVAVDVRTAQETMSRKIDAILQQFDEGDYRASA